MSAVLKKFNDQRAFTLMELMIVLVVIGILMASVFKLFSAVSSNSQKADTTARLERLRNAISGFYSSYGTYPPVPLYSTTDPFDAADDRGSNGGADIPWSGDDNKSKAALWASRSQPVSFEYPYPQTYDAFINEKYGSQGIQSANEVYQNAATIPTDAWEQVKMFKFGLMSFLLPRVALVGIPSGNGSWSENQPIPDFYKSVQWRRHNKTSRFSDNASDAEIVNALRGQDLQEQREIAKWIPNLENLVSGRPLPQIMDTDVFRDEHVNDSQGGSRSLRGAYARGGQLTLLWTTTVVDAWGNDFFYYSAPPYQSYRIWSAGPDGKTFPPWVPLESLSSSDRELVSGWIKDDIVGFDR